LPRGPDVYIRIGFDAEGLKCGIQQFPMLGGNAYAGLYRVAAFS